MKTLLVAVMLISGAGCANDFTWKIPPGGSSFQFDEDNESCIDKAESSRSFGMYSQNLAMSLAARSRAQQIYQRCMKSKHYTMKEG
jgi:hypothetical protein